MNSLDEINAFLDDEFEERFHFDDIVIDFTNADDAISDFESQFGEYYNSDIDYVDLGEIKQLCNFNKVMKICEFVAEKYEEYDMTIEKSHFEDNDKILKAYIYFYMDENHYGRYVTEIEEYFAQRAEAEAEEEAEEEEEEEEPEPELPPAQ